MTRVASSRKDGWSDDGVEKLAHYMEKNKTGSLPNPSNRDEFLAVKCLNEMPKL